MQKLRRQNQIVLYTRYMDDYVILCKSRWQLRKAISHMYRVLKALQLNVHPDKRFIGKTKRGFDFLGYQFKQGRLLRPSKESYRRLRTNARAPHERGVDQSRLLSICYFKRWLFGGLKGLVSRQGGIKRLVKSILNHLNINIVKIQV